MLSSDLEEVFRQSYARVLRARGDAFFDDFYDRFFAASAQIRARFAASDMERQRRMLRGSFAVLLAFYLSRRVTADLEAIAMRHGRADLDINPEWYAVWMDCLADTVRADDPEFAPVVELAWRTALSPGIEVMKFFHAQSQRADEDNAAP